MLETYLSTEEYKSIVYPPMADCIQTIQNKGYGEDGKFRDSKKVGWEVWNYFYVTTAYHL